MVTNCAPLIADLFLFCYERDFMASLSYNGVFLCCPFSHEMSWMESWTKLIQFLRVFLPTLIIKKLKLLKHLALHLDI